MCGFGVIIYFNNKTDKIALPLQRMANSLVHRGPDDEGFILQSNSNIIPLSGSNTQTENHAKIPSWFPSSTLNAHVESYVNMGFAFRRLSIIDLSINGHQPMSYMNRFWIVFNGEIYNYLEIRDRLISSGYIFHSNSDTEVIMAAFNEWGQNCVEMFNGMWSFVLYDSYKCSFFISRDRFGIKPLVYYIDEEKIILASEIKAILASGLFTPEPNYPFIKKFLKEGIDEYGPETSFKYIYRFAKASSILFDQTTITSKKFVPQTYYKLRTNLSREEFNKEKCNDYALEYYNLLQDSIKLRMRADVMSGTCLSGGLDSSSIAYVVNRMLKEKGVSNKQAVFSLIFPKKETQYCDESEIIYKLEKKLNLNLKTISPDYKDVKNIYEKMIYTMDNPQESSLMSYMFTYKLVKENGVTITLDGQGADELQAGYMIYLFHYFCYLPMNRIWNEFHQYKKLQNSGFYIANGIIFNIARRLRLKAPIKHLSKLLNKKIDPFLSLNERLLLDFNTGLVSLLHYGDRGSMANSIESRFPFLDYRLVEFWFNLPASYKLNNGFTKYLARDTFDGILPDEITWQKFKMGWEIPHQEWLNQGLEDWALQNIKHSEIFKKLKCKTKAKKVSSKRKPLKYFFRYHNTALWYKVFFIDKMYLDQKHEDQ